jgi:hypothetical protein
MNHTSRTHTADDVGHNRSETADHLMRTRGFHWPISLAVINQQGQTLLQTLKTDKAGIMVRYPSEVGGLERANDLPMPPPRSWCQNPHTFERKPYGLGTWVWRSRSTRD